MILKKGYVRTALFWMQIVFCLVFYDIMTNSAAFFYFKQKRKGLKGSVDLEKVKCVEKVQPEPNSPMERQYAFQVVFLQYFYNKLRETGYS